jgi:fibronectin type 3 domain-containing protein
VDIDLVTESGGKAALTWKASVSPRAKEYRIYRAQLDEPWKSDLIRIAATPATSGTRFEDERLEPGKVYVYRVTAVSDDGTEGPPSLRVRTQPRVLLRPTVSVLARDRIEVTWSRHPASDVVGYNVYRGVATVRTVKEGSPGPWRDNDPRYAEPQVVEVLDITELKKLNAQLLVDTSCSDDVDLGRKGPEAADYKYAVHAYVVRAVNRLGTESGPSPYALTIPSEPLNVLCREDGEVAELKWDPSAEKGVVGYHVYKLEGTWNIVRITSEPLSKTTLRHQAGKDATRYWVVAVDVLGQEGQPSSPAWFGHSHQGFFKGEWHQ